MKQKDQHIQSTYHPAPWNKGTQSKQIVFQRKFQEIVRDSQPDGKKSSIPFSYLLSGTKYLGQVHFLFVSFFSDRYLWLKSESSEHKRIILD